jgi:hypothetical protein
MMIGRTDEQQNSVPPNGSQCRGSVWRLFAKPIWASGHVPHQTGRTHDRTRTDNQAPNPKTPCTKRAVHTWGAARPPAFTLPVA